MSATNPNLRRLRGGFRTSVTGLITKARAELDKGDGGDKVKLGVYHNRLSEKLAKIQELDQQIIEEMQADADSTAEQYEQETATQEERSVETLLVIGQLADRLGGDDLLNAEEKPAGGAVNAPNHVKLPKLEIRWFAGDPLEFPTFEQQFTASVGQANICCQSFILEGILKGRCFKVDPGSVADQ